MRQPAPRAWVRGWGLPSLRDSSRKIREVITRPLLTRADRGRRSANGSFGSKPCSTALLVRRQLQRLPAPFGADPVRWPANRPAPDQPAFQTVFLGKIEQHDADKDH